MRKRSSWFIVLLSFALLPSSGCQSHAGAVSSVAPPAPGTPPPTASVLQHILVIVLENKSYAETRSAPYIASLIAQGASFSDNHAITHPSQAGADVTASAPVGSIIFSPHFHHRSSRS